MLGREWVECPAGGFVLGESSARMNARLEVKVRSHWKYHQAYWMKHLHYFVDIMRLIADNKEVKQCTITSVNCGGLYDLEMWYPVALYAETLWNPYEDAETIKTKDALTRDARFV
jgi:hypothetical protein